MTHNTNLLFDHKELLHENFLQTDLGILYQAIPFDALAEKIPAPKYSISGQGCPPWFDVKGGIALLILKHYLGVSDEMLIKRINTDWSMQLFCGISLKPTERIRDKNIVSAWRMYFGNHLDIEGLQKQCAVHWKPYMEYTQVGYQDATCYESGIRYPTSIKLIWECCDSVYGIMQRERRILNMRKSRCNFERKKRSTSSIRETEGRAGEKRKNCASNY